MISSKLFLTQQPMAGASLALRAQEIGSSLRSHQANHPGDMLDVSPLILAASSLPPPHPWAESSLEEQGFVKTEQASHTPIL